MMPFSPSSATSDPSIELSVDQQKLLDNIRTRAKLPKDQDSSSESDDDVLEMHNDFHSRKSGTSLKMAINLGTESESTEDTESLQEPTPFSDEPIQAPSPSKHDSMSLSSDNDDLDWEEMLDDSFVPGPEVPTKPMPQPKQTHPNQSSSLSKASNSSSSISQLSPLRRTKQPFSKDKYNFAADDLTASFDRVNDRMRTYLHSLYHSDGPLVPKICTKFALSLH
jgi:hypothetical protein